MSGPAPDAPISRSRLNFCSDCIDRRNHVPVASTISRLLDATRVHVRFALEHGGEQVLANVLHVAELARRYEADGGISFRGFIEELREQAEDGQSGEAPILEEGSDGVRMMTVHKAKGLEFPVVILADITAKLRPAAASRYLDTVNGTCAVRLAGCSPFDLIHHEAGRAAARRSRRRAPCVRRRHSRARSCSSFPPLAMKSVKDGSSRSIERFIRHSKRGVSSRERPAVLNFRRRTQC